MAARIHHRKHRELVVVVLAILTFFVSACRLRDPLERFCTNRRPFEARVSLLRHAALGARTINAADSAALAELHNRALTTRRAEDLHRAAVAHLALNDFESARGLLSEAIRLEPTNLSVTSDLAVVEMAEGRHADAAERTARLLSTNPMMLTAAFNWALSMEKLSNRSAAIEAWERYLQIDRSGEWAVEAKRRLTELRRPRSGWTTDRKSLSSETNPARIYSIVERYPQRVRAFVQNELLPRWVESGNAADLTRLRLIADARASAGDPFLRSVITSAVKPTPELREATRIYVRAQDVSRQRDFEATAILFAEAARKFELARSPMTFAASVYAAANEFYSGQNHVALARLANVESRLSKLPVRYESVAAEAAWTRGLILFRLGEWNASLHAYRHALGCATKAGEIENEVAIEALIAGNLDRISEPEEAERYRANALRRLDAIDAAPQRMYTAFAETTWTALRANRPHVALAFIKPQREIATNTGDPLLLAETSSKRALALREIGDHSGAVVAALEARSYAAKIKTKGLRDRIRSDIEYIAATLELPQNPKGAIAALNSALAIWDEYGWRIHSAAGRLLRGETFLQIGNRRSAEADFRAGIAEMERERAAIEEPALRVAYFEHADHLFERLIELLIAERRFPEALSVAERKRARTLLDHMSLRGVIVSNAQPLTTQEIIAALDPSIAVIELTLLDDGAAMWVVASGRLAFGRSPASRTEIERAISRHRDAIARRDAAGVYREGRWLFDNLLAPVASQVMAASALIVIADGALQLVPFATLVMPDGRYLVEHAAVGGSPSVAVLLRNVRPSALRDDVLVVAQPSPAGLEFLSRAADEARGIARLYKRSRLFAGTEITPVDFLRQAGTVSSVHFSGHARVNDRQPAESALVFESSAGSTVLLTAREVAEGRLPNHPLVILAACSTGQGKMRRNEGVEGLTSSFLRAGARGVVATLWDIEDGVSASVFQSLHHSLRAGASPVAALQDAQLGMLRDADPRKRDPQTWGGIVVIGSL